MVMTPENEISFLSSISGGNPIPLSVFGVSGYAFLCALLFLHTLQRALSWAMIGL